jgi:DNA polymerase-3 subunit alpha
MNSDLAIWIEDNHLDIVPYLEGTPILDTPVGLMIELDPIKGKFFDKKMNLIIYEREEGGEYRHQYSEYVFDLVTKYAIEYFVYKFSDEFFYTKIGRSDIQSFRYIGQSFLDIKIPTAFLGIHGRYEQMNGSRDYSDWCKKANFLNVQSLAICEENTLAGVIQFQSDCKKAKIKSIIGYTCKIANDSRDPFYCKLYVKQESGWRSLLRINKIINIDSEETIITPDQFFELLEGLIVVITPSKHTIKKSFLSKLKQKIDPQDLFYQLSTNEYSSNERDLDLLKSTQFFIRQQDEISPVLISDAYCLDYEDVHLKKILNSCGKRNFPDLKNHYFRSIDELFFELDPLFEEDSLLRKIFKISCKNTLTIAEACNYSIDLDSFHLPQYEMTEDEIREFESNEELFDFYVQEKAQTLYSKYGEEVIRQRIDVEVDVIKRGGFVDYFLILWDIIRWCEDNGILTGVGRGSAGGSLVAYCLGIIKLNPLDYGLLFERFLNEGRLGLELPDIDTDFDSERRDEVIDYMKRRYGEEYVCRVGTYTTLQMRGLFKDLGRSRYDSKTLNIMTKMIEEESNTKWTGLFSDASRKPQLKSFVQNNGDIISDCRIALNAIKSSSQHACATIIVPKSNNLTIFEQIPIRKDENGALISEWEGEQLAKAGFLKEDILSTKQMCKINQMFALIKENHGITLTLEGIPKDDGEVYRFFQEGYNQDVFHFGSTGLTDYLKKLKPTNIDDLIAAIALYRPGSMVAGAHEDYIKFKNGEKEPTYDYGLIEVTKETYGLYCIAENMQVHTNKGDKPIQNIQVGEYVLTEDGSYQRVVATQNNGERNDIVKIRTTYGRELLCTEDHQVLTQDGWKKAMDLTVQDIIKGFPSNGQTQVGNDLHWILGLYLADGHSGSCPSIYCSDMIFAQKVQYIIQKNFPNMKGLHILERNNGLGICWSVEIRQKMGFNGSFSKDHQSNDFNVWLKSLGLLNKTKNNKFIPKEYYSLNLIAGFIEGDGCIKNKTITIANEVMANQLFEAMSMNLIHCNYFVNSSGYFCISFCDNFRKIPLKIKSIPDNLQNLTYYPIDYLPQLKETDGFHYRNYSIKSARKKNRIIPSNVVLKYANQVDHEFWGKVLSIQKSTKAIVYDLSIETNHSFVCQNLTVHNCYQEQIMKACQVLGGFTLVEADGIRKAMGKKIKELMDSYKDQFIKGAISNGCSEEEANVVWNKLEVFSGYGFNKSHAAAYAITGYICNWIKVHYPMEFWTIAFTKGSPDDLPYYITEIHKTGDIKIVPPDINRSNNYFVADFNKQEIVWAIDKITQCGVAVTNAILEERKNGKFYSFDEFISRVPKSIVKKQVVINLILSGAFDDIESIRDIQDRKRLIVDYMKIRNQDVPPEFSGKRSLAFWELMQMELSKLGTISYKKALTDSQSKLKNLIEYLIDPQYFYDRDMLPEKTFCMVSGVVSDVNIRTDKFERQYADITINSNGESILIRIFADIWTGKIEGFDHWRDELSVSKGKILFITGIVSEWGSVRNIQTVTKSYNSNRTSQFEIF